VKYQEPNPENALKQAHEKEIEPALAVKSFKRSNVRALHNISRILIILDNPTG